MMMKVSTLALAALSALPVVAQQAMTGVSHPEDTAITASAEPARPAKPSAAVPMTERRAAKTQEYVAYVPYAGAKRDSGVVASAKPLTDEEADGSVVTTVVERSGELREGTLLRARLDGRLSTLTSAGGTRFTAQLVEPVEKNGRVVLPIGSLVEGRVTSVHAGKRITGAAVIHLEADGVDLPDGTKYAAHLLLIDTDQTRNTKVDSEGSLVRRDHPKETLAAVGLATGGAAAAGGLIGGGLGAAVGAGIGAGAGTVLWLKQDRQEVVPEHALLVFSLSEPMRLVPERETAKTRPVVGNPDAMVVGVE